MTGITKRVIPDSGITFGMIKTIKTDQLRLGMYVTNLQRDWLKHSFFFSRFLLNDPKKLQKILASGIEEVQIDTEKGLDVTAPTASRPRVLPTSDPIANAPPREDTEISPPVPLTGEKLVYAIPLQIEIQMARKVLTEAHQVIGRIMSDVRFGRQINLQEVDQTITKITESILKTPDALIGLSRLKGKDIYAFQHSVEVCALLISFCTEIGMDALTVKKVATGGLLQDVGMMQMPMELISKTGNLTQEEYLFMQKHVDFSRQILERTPSIPRIALTIASQHHERCDGSGYPGHLESAEISLYAKMAAIADIYDAASSHRHHRRALEPTEALREIYEMRSTQLDTELVDQFIKHIGIYPAGSLVALDNGLIGFVIRTNRENLLLPAVRIVYDSHRNLQVPHYDLDLSQPTPNGTRQRIVGHESPEKWGIDPLSFF